MFSLFEQLPIEIQYGILIYYPQSLPKLICTSKNIQQLISNYTYKYFDTSPTEAETKTYFNSNPMLLKYEPDGANGYNLHVTFYNSFINKHMLIREKILPGPSDIYHAKEYIRVKMINGKITPDGNHLAPFELDMNDCADLKQKYKIYSSRTSFINRNPQYAKSKALKQVDDIYHTHYSTNNPPDLILLIYYLNHNLAIFNDSSTDIIEASRLYPYLTCSDLLELDDDGLLEEDQWFKSHIEELYHELVNKIQNA